MSDDRHGQARYASLLDEIVLRRASNPETISPDADIVAHLGSACFVREDYEPVRELLRSLQDDPDVLAAHMQDDVDDVLNFQRL